MRQVRTDTKHNGRKKPTITVCWYIESGEAPCPEKLFGLSSELKKHLRICKIWSFSLLFELDVWHVKMVSLYFFSLWSIYPFTRILFSRFVDLHDLILFITFWNVCWASQDGFILCFFFIMMKTSIFKNTFFKICGFARFGHFDFWTGCWTFQNGFIFSLLSIYPFTRILFSKFADLQNSILLITFWNIWHFKMVSFGFARFDPFHHFLKCMYGISRWFHVVFF